MARQNKAYLTGRFETGDKPVGQDFADWIESGFNLEETGTQKASGSLHLLGDIIATQYIVSSSVTNKQISYSSGSTDFGDSLDDTHQRTGSMSITGSLTATTLHGDGSALTGVAAFPFTGDAIITGSLTISGSNAFRMDSSNVVLGQNAGGGSVDTGVDDNNVIIGADAAGAGNLNNGDSSVIIGHEAGYNKSTGDAQVLIGNTAGKYVGAGSTNVFIGNLAGGGSVAYNPGGSNIAIGYYAGAAQGATQGSSNVIVGVQAGQQKVGANNVLIGRNVMYNATTGGDGSVIIGKDAGYVSAGDNNIFIGFECGVAATTGDNNILIGKGVEKSAVDTSNQLRIGNEAVIAISADLSTGDVSIGGTLSGDGSGLTGVGGGGNTVGFANSWFF